MCSRLFAHVRTRIHTLGRTSYPGSRAPGLGHTGQHSSSFSVLLLHIRPPLCASLPLSHLVIAAKFLPLLHHRLPPHCPLQLSAAHNLLITLHPSTPVSAHCAFPQLTPVLFLKLPIFPLLSSHSLYHFKSGLRKPLSSTSLAGTGVSLPALSAEFPHPGL